MRRIPEVLKNTQLRSKDTDSGELNNQKTKPTDLWKYRGLLIAVSALYGTNFGCVKVLGDAIDPSVAAAIRFLIAFLVFLPSLPITVRNNPKLAIGGLEVGAYNAIGYWAQANALRTSASATVAFLCSLQVIVVPILNAMLSKNSNNSRRPLFSTLFPAVLAAIGVACLELGGGTLPGLGDLWAMVQPVMFGLAFWRVETIMQQSKSSSDSQGFTAASLSVVASTSLVWCAQDFLLPLLQHSRNLDGDQALQTALHQLVYAIASDWKVPAALLWTGIVTTALTTFGENVAMKRLDAAESTVIFSTEPLWGTLFASVALGEVIGWNTAFGAAFIIAACSWRTAGVGALATLTTMQEAVVQAVQEVGVNVGANVAQLVQMLMGRTSDLPEL
jgi:drug/metabolite transporter (DMT)-like permease